MMSNQALWESSALFITYDEHDGYFDHTLAPAPEPGTASEFISSLPIGFGPRVPMLICSPWTRGGYVDSNVYDHTSMLSFLETWTGVKAPNISAWRRSVAGGLTAAFDFASPDFSIPGLPDTVPLITQSGAEKSFPAVSPPAAGRQQPPVQESGTRPHRPSSHNPHADVTVDRTGGNVTATMSNVGGKVGVSLFVFPDAYLAASATPFTVVDGTDRTYVWSSGKTKERYAFSVYGPDGFVRSFAGTVAAAQNSGQVSRVAATLVPGAVPVLQLTLANDGNTGLSTPSPPNDYAGTAQSVQTGRQQPGHGQLAHRLLRVQRRDHHG